MTFEDLRKKVKYVGDMEDELTDVKVDIEYLKKLKLENYDRQGFVNVGGNCLNARLTVEELIEAYTSKQKELEVDIAQEKELLNLQVKTQGVLK